MWLFRRLLRLSRLLFTVCHEEVLDGLRERRGLLEEVRRVEPDPERWRGRERERERRRRLRGLRDRFRFCSAFLCAAISSLKAISFSSLPSRRKV